LNTRAAFRILAATAAAMVAAACGGGSAGSPSSPSGSGGGASLGSSHNAGRNCLQCHNSFRLAGTAWNASGTAGAARASVRVTSAPDGGGSVLATLTSDATGNFYTSQSVALGGVYVDVTGASGTRRSMKAALTNGGCNSCHGVSTGRIQVE
jgi:hypothetical protein